VKTLLIDPFSGASGDMLLASLLDAGAPLDAVTGPVLAVPALASLKVGVENVMRGFLSARRLVVDMPHEHAHRGLSDVTAIIDGSALGPRVKARAKDAFRRLAGVEARVHGLSVEEVHFHEVGALDAILDIVGFFLAAEALGIERFLYTTLALGSGTVNTAHGAIPVPAPATLELLAGHRVAFTGRHGELVTPTAAAIIAAAFKPIGDGERFVPATVGYGAGTRETDGLPNVLRACVGETIAAPRSVAVIRCTIDDMNPEVYGHAMQSLFAAGALEVYHQSVMMKKNRPGVELTVIAEEHDAQRLAAYVLANTTTLGVRVAREERVELERRKDAVETEYGRVDVKVAILPGGAERMSPEFESCRRVAEERGVPLLDVFDAARRAWPRR
jgi:hypothetical protein